MAIVEQSYGRILGLCSCCWSDLRLDYTFNFFVYFTFLIIQQVYKLIKISVLMLSSPDVLRKWAKNCDLLTEALPTLIYLAQSWYLVPSHFTTQEHCGKKITGAHVSVLYFLPLRNLTIRPLHTTCLLYVILSLLYRKAPTAVRKLVYHTSQYKADGSAVYYSIWLHCCTNRVDSIDSV